MENPFADPADIARRLSHLSSETITDLVEDAWARATEVAPCILAPEFPEDEKGDLVKTLLRAVILRWADENLPVAGNTTTRVAGPYQMTVEAPVRRGFRLSLGETVDFTKLCQKLGRPFTIHTDPEDDTPEDWDINDTGWSSRE